MRRLLCIILNFIEDIIMRLLPNVCGENALHLPSFCKPMGRFEGITDETIKQGTDFDLLEGVTAYNEFGEILPFTVRPSDVAICEVGTQTFTYEAEDLTAERNITVEAIPNPAIDGASTALTVEVGAEFDPLEGVTATDGNGNTLAVSVELI